MFLYTNGHISKSLRSMNFGIKLKLKSVLLTVVSKTHFTQNVTCSLFCGSESQIVQGTFKVHTPVTLQYIATLHSTALKCCNYKVNHILIENAIACDRSNCNISKTVQKLWSIYKLEIFPVNEWMNGASMRLLSLIQVLLCNWSYKNHTMDTNIELINIFWIVLN